MWRHLLVATQRHVKLTVLTPLHDPPHQKPTVEQSSGQLRWRNEEACPRLSHLSKLCVLDRQLEQSFLSDLPNKPVRVIGAENILFHLGT